MIPHSLCKLVDNVVSLATVYTQKYVVSIPPAVAKFQSAGLAIYDGPLANAACKMSGGKSMLPKN